MKTRMKKNFGRIIGKESNQKELGGVMVEAVVLMSLLSVIGIASLRGVGEEVDVLFTFTAREVAGLGSGPEPEEWG